MKKWWYVLIGTMLLCSLFTGCEKRATVSVGQEGRYTLNLSEELNNDQLELNNLPWFSTPEEVMNAFGLSLNGVTMYPATLSSDRKCMRMYLPVWLEDMELPADMALLFRWDYPVPWEDEPLRVALTSVSFTTYFADQTSEQEIYFEKLQTVLNTLTENQPKLYNRKLEAATHLIYQYRQYRGTALENNGEPELAPVDHCINVNQCGIRLGAEKAYAGCTLVIDVNQPNPNYAVESGDQWI